MLESFFENMRFYRHLFMYIMLFCVFFNIGRAYQTFPISFSLKDQCMNLCQNEKLPALEPNNFESFVCQSGCRFFNIIKFSGGFDITPAVKHCHITCNESYSFPTERKVCTTGCELVASRAEIDDGGILIRSSEEKTKNELVLGEPDSDLLETDLSDPSIKSQLEVGFNVDYKIPETHIRTMPIESSIHIDKPVIKESGDWLDCASKNSGIPRWILLFIMLGTIVVAIWLTLSIESRKSADDLEEGIVLNIPNDLPIMENFIIEKDPWAFEKDYLFDNVKFMPPPKYSGTIENDDNQPPKYSDVVNNQTKE